MVERMVHAARARRRGARPARLRRARVCRPDAPDAARHGRGRDRRGPDDAADRRATRRTGGLEASPALAMVTENVFPVDGRVVQILANDGCDLAGIRRCRPP